MGLDAYAYAGLTKTDAEDDYTSVFEHPDFPNHHEGLEPGKYSYKEEQDVFHGAYSRYNRWREALADMLGYETEPGWSGEMSAAQGAWNQGEGPMIDLINFSDCDGCIGPVLCAKLAGEFAEHQAKADAHPDGEFRQHYASFRAGFELAAAGEGMVKFS